MKVPVINFNKNNKPEFYKVLNKRVNKYFIDNKLEKQANLNMKLKTAFMVGLYFIPLFVLLSGQIASLGVIMLMWVLMGLGMSGIGLAIMHDANHGSYSKNPAINKALGFLINFLGGYHITWIIQHNVLHHSYTNIQDFDEDLDQTVMRFSPNQEYKEFYKYQAFYAPFFYALLSLFRFSVKDFQQLKRYNALGLIEAQGLTYRRAIMGAIFNKVWYLGLTIVLPMLILPVAWWVTILGFLVMHFICGMILALVFQPAHVIEETEFFVVDEHGSLENNWAIHEMKTTANFANQSNWFSWFVGGLNFQVEHHLFPHICHVHYKNIAPIVIATAKEFNVPYHSHKTFFQALKSHFSMLHSLGSKDYVMPLAKAS